MTRNSAGSGRGEGLAARCPDCDDTGDVTRFDGEWMGYCSCPAGTALRTRQPQQAKD